MQPHINDVVVLPPLKPSTIASVVEEPQDDSRTPVFGPVTANSIKVMALFDTGAGRSCISRDFLDKLGKVRLTPFQGDALSGLGGSPLHIKTVAHVEVNFAGVRITWPFAIVENSAVELLIGNDLMGKVGANVHLGKSVVMTAHGKLPITFEKRDVFFRRQRVVLDRDLEFKPFTAYINPIAVSLRPSTVAIMVPSPDLQHETSIRSACTIDSVSPDHLIMLNLVNGTMFPITLKKGTIIGELNPVLRTNINTISNLTPAVNTHETEEEFLAQFSFDRSLTLTQLVQIKKVLLDYRDRFLNKIQSTDVIQTHIKHRIITEPDARRVQSQPYVFGPAERKIESDAIDDMLSSGVIEPSASPWSSPVVLVRKKDGTIRFCIDYRRLNKVTVRDMYPLPRLDHTLDSLSGMVWFSTMDCVSGYWQILMHPDDVEKTAFATHRGLYQFKVMPFGLVNAPMTFQRAMDVILSGLKYEICLCYLDDIIVFSRTWEEHLKNLRTVLERIKSAGIYLKPTKCQFARRSITFLGHQVSADGVTVTPEKVKAVLDFPTPSKAEDIKVFLGLVNFYRPFLRNIAQIQRPLTDLLKTDSKWSWNNAQQAAFDEIKHILTSKPILGLPDYDKPFILSTDASLSGIGAVLTQTSDNGLERVISYYSRPLQPAERNYSITELEALAMVKAIEHYRPYLFGRRFTVVTDHQALVYLHTNRQPTGRLARWQAALMDYDYDVVYRAGSKHTHADALSRYPVATLTPQPPAPWPWTREDLIKAQDEDPSINFIKEFVVHKTFPRDHLQRFYTLMYKREWLVEDNILYRLFDNPVIQSTVRQLVVPESFRKLVLEHSHDSVLGGHYGFNKMFYRVRQDFYWPGMSEDIRHYIQTCDSCNARKLSLDKQIGDLQPLQSHEPFDIIGVDLVGPLPTTNEGYRYLLVVQDLFSKWVEAFPIRSKTAKEVADVLVREVICRFGSPRQILSDNGKEFVNEILTEVCKVIGSVKIFTAPYRPQTDGQVERFNKTLVNTISHFTDEDARNWNYFVPFACFAYRITRQTSTQASPFEILFGRIARSPLLNGILSPDDLKIDPTSYAHQVSKQFLFAYDIVRRHIKDAQDAMAYNYNLQRRDFSYGVGDMVWLFVNKRPNKFAPRFKGPYIITKKLSDLNYMVRDLNGKPRRRITVNVNQLKPFVSRHEYSDSFPDEIPLETKKKKKSRASPETPAVQPEVPPASAPVPTIPTNPTTNEIPTRRSVRSRSNLQVLAETLIDIRRRFEELPTYSIKALKTQLRDLLGPGSVFVRSSSLNRRFNTRVSQINNRVSALEFLHNVTTDFNNEFESEIKTV